MQKLGFVKRIIDFDLDKTYVAKQGEIIKTISKTEIDALAKKNLPYNNMIILIVGDKASNLKNYLNLVTK
jgi:zinc protease